MWDSESGTPLADMVRDAADAQSYRQLADRAVDPRTGYRASHSTLWKIGHGEQVKISPQLVRAVAAAVGLPARDAQVAAAQQYIGLMAGDPIGASTSEATVVMAHVPGLTAGDMPRVQDLLTKWAAGERRAGEGQ